MALPYYQQSRPAWTVGRRASGLQHAQPPANPQAQSASLVGVGAQFDSGYTRPSTASWQTPRTLPNDLRAPWQHYPSQANGSRHAELHDERLRQRILLARLYAMQINQSPPYSAQVEFDEGEEGEDDEDEGEEESEDEDEDEDEGDDSDSDSGEDEHEDEDDSDDEDAQYPPAPSPPPTDRRFPPGLNQSRSMASDLSSRASSRLDDEWHPVPAKHRH